MAGTVILAVQTVGFQKELAEGPAGNTVSFRCLRRASAGRRASPVAPARS